MPTIAEYCRVPTPDRKIDGKSIVSLIESGSAPSPHETLHWQSGKHWAVRQGDWKLIHNGPATQRNGRKIPKVENFLSNIAEDVTETRNRAKDHPDIVQRLTTLHKTWTQEVRQQ